MQADFTLEDHGTVAMLTPHNDSAKQYIEETLETEGWQWLGRSLAVERRQAQGLIDMMQEDGFSVETV